MNSMPRRDYVFQEDILSKVQFTWDELDGKQLLIRVIHEDGHTLVTGHSDDNRIYILHEEHA